MSPTAFWTDFFQNGIPSLKSLSWSIPTKHHQTIIDDEVDMIGIFPSLKRLNFDARTFQPVNLPNLTHLAIHNMAIFDCDSVNFVDSLEELTIIKPKPGRSTPGGITTMWSKAMRSAVNLRSIKIDSSPSDVQDFIHLIDQIPKLTSIHLITAKGLVQSQLMSFIKRQELRRIKIEDNISVSPLGVSKMEVYRKRFHADSDPIDIYLPTLDSIDGQKEQIDYGAVKNDDKSLYFAHKQRNVHCAVKRTTNSW